MTLLPTAATAQSAPTTGELIAQLRAAVAQEMDADQLAGLYGALVSVTTAPEISAANYRVRDDAATPSLHLYKLPLNWNLPSDSPDWAPYLQTSLGLMEMSSEFEFIGERNLSNWRAYGGSVGLGARHGQGPLRWIGQASLGLVHIENRARFDGPIGRTLLKPALSNLLFDWEATARQTGLALGADYERQFPIWTLVGELRLSSTHVRSFKASSAAVEFNTSGTALTLHSDSSRALPFRCGGYPTRLHLRLGGTAYLGENRKALGFDRFVEFGGGLEMDVGAPRSAVRTVQLSALGIYGPDVVGWSLSVNFGF